MIFCIEGVDGVGKATQAARLVARLRAEGREVDDLAFPQYETPTGRLIGMLLRGERVLAREAYGELRATELDEGPLVLQALMTVNRLEQVALLRERALPSPVLPALVLDRYWLSAVAYGVAAGLDREWLLAIHADFPRARTVWLDVLPEVALARRAARDRHEGDAGLQARARAEYARLAEGGYCTRVDGVGTVDEVEGRVWAALERPRREMRLSS